MKRIEYTGLALYATTLNSLMQQRSKDTIIAIVLSTMCVTTSHNLVLANQPSRFWTSRDNNRRSLFFISLRGGSDPYVPNINRPSGNNAALYPQSNAMFDSTIYQNPTSSITNDETQQYSSIDSASSPSPEYTASPSGGETMVDPIHETVQDRLDAWKEKQLQNMAQYQQSALDDKGRAKLVISVSKPARIFVFGLFTWRTLHIYEQIVGTSASSANPLVGPKVLVTLPVFLLFLADILGTILSFANVSSFTKKRLKAILNLNKVVEFLVLFHSIVRLTVWPSRYITKEIYLGRIIHSIFLLVQLQAFTRLSWDETAAPSIQTYNTIKSTNPPQRVHEDPQQNLYRSQSYSGSSL